MRKQSTDLQCHGRAEQETSKLYICHCSTHYTLEEPMAHRNLSLLKCCTAEQNDICALFVFHSPSDALPTPPEPRQTKEKEKDFGKEGTVGKHPFQSAAPLELLNQTLPDQRASWCQDGLLNIAQQGSRGKLRHRKGAFPFRSFYCPKE